MIAIYGPLPYESTAYRPNLDFAGAVLGIFIWVGQSKAKQILGWTTEVVYVGIMGMTRAVWAGQARVRGLPGLIARTASGILSNFFQLGVGSNSQQHGKTTLYKAEAPRNPQLDIKNVTKWWQNTCHCPFQ